MRNALLITCLALATAGIARAQDAAKDTSAKSAARDTLPFHKGQWGAEFAAGTTFASAGVLYFRSPSSAWLFDVDFGLNYDKSSVHQTDTLFSSPSGTGTEGFVTLRAGLRNYHALAAQTQFFTSFGGLVSYNGTTIRGDFPANQWSAGAGIFGEIGGNYMINPHVGLGATAGVNLTYLHRETHTGGGSTEIDDLVALSGALFALRLGIFF